ncbi:MAG: energy-coupling factor ABC transporter ATP-binding protein [Bacteroidota bacterium]
MEKVLEWQSVSFKYANTKVWALKDVSLCVTRGEFVGIVGPNGAGKSTLARTSNGLIPSAYAGTLTGKVLVLGEETSRKATWELASTVGLVYSDTEAQMSQMTVWEEIAFGPSNLGLPRPEVCKRVDEMLSLLRLERFRDRSPFSLSGGEQQRVAIASVLAMKPEILVLDEPTANLDPVGITEVFETVARLNREQGITVVMIEHELELLAEHASRIVVLEAGSVVAEGAPDQILRQTELFARLHIRLPGVTRLAEILDRQYGLWPAKYPLTVEQAYEALATREER